MLINTLKFCKDAQGEVCFLSEIKGLTLSHEFSGVNKDGEETRLSTHEYNNTILAKIPLLWNLTDLYVGSRYSFLDAATMPEAAGMRNMDLWIHTGNDTATARRFYKSKSE